MKGILYNLLIICIVALLIYFIFNNITITEGMTNNIQSTNSQTLNGIAGNAESFAAQIKANTIKMQDTLLISKYRKDYENIIINMDDYINNMMLDTVLKFNIKDDNKNIEIMDKLNKLNQAKVSLNAVMKFVDRTS